jgi:hypothetical protein
MFPSTGSVQQVLPTPQSWSSPHPIEKQSPVSSLEKVRGAKETGPALGAVKGAELPEPALCEDACARVRVAWSNGPEGWLVGAAELERRAADREPDGEAHFVTRSTGAPAAGAEHLASPSAQRPAA